MDAKNLAGQVSTFGDVEVVHIFNGEMPTGVAVSRTGRIFICFPKWGDDVKATVTEIHQGKTVPFPDSTWNSPSGKDDAKAFVSVQSVVVDPHDRLWILDSGSPLFESVEVGGPKLVCVDLHNNSVVQVITFPAEVALSTTYLNDVRFDLTRGEAGYAFITDSSDKGPNGIIVVDLADGKSWRRLHDHPSVNGTESPDLQILIEGRPFFERLNPGEMKPVKMGSDGIAISADGERLYFCPLASRRLYSVSVEHLVNRNCSDSDIASTIRDEGDKGSISDGLETDSAGNIYATAPEHYAILRYTPAHRWETVAHDARILWPDSMAIGADEHLYFTVNQLHRQAKYQEGRDRRTHPYELLRVRIDNGPVVM